MMNRESFLPLFRFTNAVDEFHAELVALHNQHATTEQTILALVAYAPAVVESVWPLRSVMLDGVLALDPETQADLGMLGMMGGIADRAAKEGDVTLSNDQKDVLDRMRVHVARRIVEALKGSVESLLEFQLRASIEANAAKVHRDVESATNAVATARRSFPHEVVPLHGKAGA